MTTELLSSYDSIRNWQEDLYQDLHQYPELSMEEVRTRQVIADQLESFGYQPQHIGGGVVGTMENGSGPGVLFRADFDGLPVTEATGLPYASKNEGKMHACGHDLHVSCALGVARLLAENLRLWSGTYVALFQPGEETAQGAKSMVDAGLVEMIPRPDVALGQHVMPQPVGIVETAAGPVFSQADSIRITVFGKGSHGSMPHLGVDPVVLAAAIVMRLQGVVSREISPADFGVVTVGSLQAGTKSNIIPDHAELLLNLRTYDSEVRGTLITAIERIVRAECEASGSPKSPVFEYFDQFPLTNNDPQVTKIVTEAFTRYFGEDRVMKMDPVTASEDFSNIPNAFGTPYCYWGLGGFESAKDIVPNHNPRFAPVMQPTLQIGTEAAVTAVMAYLGK